jgi:predicted dehydrogenase
LDYIKKEFPFVDTTKNYKDIIKDKTIHAVIIATPVKSHKDIAEESLFFGKNVFIEKPMTYSSEDAESLVVTAKKLNKKIAVGHVFQFSPAVRKIKSLLKSNAIGDVLHITSSRINLGPPESEVDVIWDLGPHDFSILLHLLEEIPWKILCNKESYLFSRSDSHAFPKKRTGSGLINNAHIDLSFKSGITAHVHLSWLSSNKTRLMQIIGTQGTIVYDEMLALDGKVKLFGKGIDNRIKNKTTDAVKLGYHMGEIQVMQLEQHEPLRLECEEFINAIIKNTPLVNDGKIGLEVVKMLETASESFKSKT